MAPKISTESRIEIRETRGMVNHGFQLARELGISTLLVSAELSSDRKRVDNVRDQESIIWVAQEEEATKEVCGAKDQCVEIPHGPVGPRGLPSNHHEGDIPHIVRITLIALITFFFLNMFNSYLKIAI